MLALFVAIPATVVAQDDLITQGIRAYQSLEFDHAATLLRGALSNSIEQSTRVRALAYLGAAEHYRGRDDSATAAFRRLAVLAPRYQPDTLVFPPEITRRYADVQRRLAPAAEAMQLVVQIPLHLGGANSLSVVDHSPIPAHRAAAGFTGTISGLVETVRARSRSGGLPLATGTVFGMSADARLGRFALGVRYLEGSLQTSDLVEGAAALRFVTTSWLTLQAGPQIRRFETPLGAERWVTWQLGARSEIPVAASLHAHAMVWRGLGLSVNVLPGSGTAGGGEVGVTLVPGGPGGPFSFGLTYGIDQMSLRGSNRRNTFQTVNFTAGLRRLP